MAEALCGPSNALQTFQKHTSVDRTLQQDRIFSRQSHTQGFRSSSPLAGALDAEFQAFQAPQHLAAPPISFQPVPSPQSFAQAQIPGSNQHAFEPRVQQQQNIPNWATDFQRLNISNPNSSAQSTFFRPQEQLSNNRGVNSWHEEFLKQGHNQLSQSHSSPMHTSLYAAPAYTQTPEWHPGMGDAMSFQPHTMQQQSVQQIPSEQFQFDDAAFEQAFGAAETMVQESEVSKGKERADNVEQPRFNMGFACTDPGDVMGEYDFDQNAATLGLERPAVPETKLNQAELTSAREDLGVHDIGPGDALPRIGSDTIPAQTGLSPEAEVDELARTAGQLLDTLKDEQNVKFQQSGFLGLMRKFRDKEVRIEEGKVTFVSAT